MKALRAELVADRGAAATGPEFFRCPTFLLAEGVTHSLVIGGGRIVLPVIRRDVIPWGGHDAISPYGYPGGLLRDDPPHVADIDFTDTGLISLFVRERLGAPTLRGGAVRGAVLVHEPSQPRAVTQKVMREARSTERLGYRFEAVPSAAVDDDLLLAFERAYVETMRRVGAGQRYYFGTDYLRDCLRFDSSWLAVVRGPEGDLASAAFVAISDGYLHNFLTATADAHRARSPAKNVMIGMVDQSDELGLPLNLGGGLRGRAGLHAFKARFTNMTAEFVTHDVVCDHVAYARLTADRGPTSFFPAYRAPRTAGGVEGADGSH
ncbi:MAG: GNAT family N-acetyltransferase [Pseudonocardiaceae bacterium]